MAKTTFLERLAERVQRIDKQELLHLLTDVTRDKAALESVLQSLGEGIILLDLSGRVLFANRTVMSWMGQSARDLAADPTVAEVFAAANAQPSQSFHREVQAYSPRAMLLSVDCVPFRGEKGQILGIAAVLRDITDKRRMEGRMVQSEKLGALTALAAGLAHEIGNPLNSITIHLQLIAREIKKLKGAGKVQKLNATVSAEIKRLDDIVHRFLTAIRPLRPKLETHNINDIVRDVLRLLKHELRRHQVNCQTQLRDSVAPTLLDSAQMKQALINICKNAMQAMPKGGTLTIETGMRDGGITVRITDTGTGIAPENLSKIFDPYFTTRREGSGLGLMMTQRIVKEHGGEIEVKSEPGRGTEFLIGLPVRSAQPKMLSEKTGRDGK